MITLQNILESKFLLGGHPIPQVFEMLRYLHFTDNSNAILDKIMLFMIIFTKSVRLWRPFARIALQWKMMKNRPSMSK
ncbi:putative cytochrome P450 [Trichinella spiralis]|uniref:Cytochrome P450 n=1 Tax=Trichinella spiralis TaxID=6334 RepID=A0ABR3KKK2_TRISP